MKPRARKLLQTLLAALAIALTLVLFGIVPINISPLHGIIEERVRDATGLQLSLDGATVIRLGPRAGVRVDKVSLAAPGEASFFELDEAEAGISLLALFRGRIHVRKAAVTGVRLDCSLIPELPASSGEDDGPLPEIAIDSVEVREAAIHCTQYFADISVDRAVASAPAGGPVALEASGSVSASPVILGATGGRLEQLLGGAEFPFQANLEHADVELGIRGTLLRVFDDPEAEIGFEVRVPDLERVGRSFGISLPDAGALGVEGHVRAHAGGGEFTIDSGTLGETRLSATGRADMAGERVFVELSSSVQQLDLSPYLGGEDEQVPGSPANGSSDIDLSGLFDAMSLLDGALQLTVDRVLGLPIEVRSGEVSAALADGVLELSPASAELLGGQVDIAGSVGSREECPPVALVVKVRDVDLATLPEANLINTPVAGHVSVGEASLRSCGRSLSEYVYRLAATMKVSGTRLTSAGRPSIDISRLEAGMSPREPTRATLSANIAGESVQASLVVGSLQDLLGHDAWPLELVATGAGSRLKVDGRARFAEGGLMAELTSDFSAPEIGSLHPWVDVAPDAGLPLHAGSKVIVDGTGLVARDVALAIGDSDLQGHVTWNHEQAPDVLKLELRSGYIDLEQLAGLIPATDPSSNGPERQDASEPGQIQLPAIDLDLGFEAIKGGRLDIQGLAVVGRLRRGLIDNAAVSVLVEDELRLQGELDLDVRSMPASGVFEGTAANADLGRLLRRLELVDDLNMRADGLGLRIATEGANPQDFVTNSRIDADVNGFAWDVAAPGSDGDKAYKVRLARLGLSAAPRRPITATSSGHVDDVLVDFHIQAPPLAEWLDYEQEFPLRVIAAADDDVVMIFARIDHADEERLQTYLELSGQRLEREGRELESLESPLADYHLRGNLTFDASGVRLPDLEARLGTSTASGSIELNSEARQRLIVELTSPQLQTDDLLYLDASNGNEAVANHAPAASDSPGEIKESNSRPRGPLLVAHDLIVEYQQNYDLDLRLAVDELRTGDDLLGGADLRLTIEEDEFRLSPLSVRLPGGGIDAEYEWRLRGGKVAARLSARADRLVYGDLLRLADPTSEARGLLDLDVDISADTEWQPDISEFELLLRSANGSIDFAAWPENIEAGILDLWTANLVFALLPVSAEGEPSRLNCVVARLEAEDGMLKTKNVMLDSTETIIRARGNVDLAQGELDLLVTPQAKREKFLSASTPVKVTGPLNDFQIGVEPAGIFGTVIKWYTSLIYVPYKWLTGQRFPPDGTRTCFDAMDWELTPELEAYFLRRDFSSPPEVD